MDQKPSGGTTITKRLDLVDDPIKWQPAAECFLHGNGESATCPECGHSAINCETVKYFGGIGYMLLTCPNCGKSAHFSRVKFPD